MTPEPNHHLAVAIKVLVRFEYREDGDEPFCARNVSRCVSPLRARLRVSGSSPFDRLSRANR
jgi:hypothetical protein